MGLLDRLSQWWDSNPYEADRIAHGERLAREGLGEREDGRAPDYCQQEGSAEELKGQTSQAGASAGAEEVAAADSDGCELAPGVWRGLARHEWKAPWNESGTDPAEQGRAAGDASFPDAVTARVAEADWRVRDAEAAGRSVVDVAAQAADAEWERRNAELDRSVDDATDRSEDGLAPWEERRTHIGDLINEQYDDQPAHWDDTDYQSDDDAAVR